MGNYPYYHGRKDTIANCGDEKFFRSTIKATVATLATLAEPFKITFTNSSVDCDASIGLFVGDRDLNADAGTIETVTLDVWSTTEPLPERIVLSERGPNSMIFAAEIPTTTDPPVPGDGRIGVALGDILTATYLDASDRSGANNVTHTATASVNWPPHFPAEIFSLVVTIPENTLLDWAEQTNADVIDIAGGHLLELRADHGFECVSCLADDWPGDQWADPRGNPVAGDGYYYLVRGENSLGPGTWGRSSDGGERRLPACP